MFDKIYKSSTNEFDLKIEEEKTKRLSLLRDILKDCNMPLPGVDEDVTVSVSGVSVSISRRSNYEPE